MRTRIWVTVAATMALVAGELGGQTLAVDLDLNAPGIQSELSANPGEVVTVGVILVDDGLSIMSGVGVSLNFNDAGMVVLPASPSIAGPLAAGSTDVVSGAPATPSNPLASEGLPAFGAGSGGAYTGTDGGAGYFDPTSGGYGGVGAFGGTPGALVLLTSIDLLVVGPAGSATDLEAFGILPIGGGPSAPADPNAVGPLASGNAPFWDADFFSGVGGFAPTKSNSATITVIPEPGGSALLMVSLVTALVRRRR